MVHAGKATVAVPAHTPALCPPAPQLPEVPRAGLAERERHRWVRRTAYPARRRFKLISPASLWVLD